MNEIASRYNTVGGTEERRNGIGCLSLISPERLNVINFCYEFNLLSLLLLLLLLHCYFIGVLVVGFGLISIF